MGTKSAEVTAYIERQQPFARPILTRLRGLFHRACPQIQETRKWGSPFFMHKGIVGAIAGFKHHVRLIIWKGKMLDDPDGVLKGAAKPTSLADLPPDKDLIGIIKMAVALNESGVKTPPRNRSAKSRGGRAGGKARPAPKPPADLAGALKRNAKAAAAFKNFSPSHQREYIEWITGAKQDQTRQRRLDQTLQWLAEGKSRNWKYETRKSPVANAPRS